MGERMNALSTVSEPAMGSSHGAYNVDSRMPRTERVTSRVIVYRSIDSTNIEAGRLLQDGTLDRKSVV